VGGMTPFASMHEREKVCWDCRRTAVRQVAAHELHGMCLVTGGGVIVRV
jgi:hypothetical protein